MHVLYGIIPEIWGSDPALVCSQCRSYFRSYFIECRLQHRHQYSGNKYSLALQHAHSLQLSQPHRHWQLWRYHQSDLKDNEPPSEAERWHPRNRRGKSWSGQNISHQELRWDSVCWFAQHSHCHNGKLWQSRSASSKLFVFRYFPLNLSSC